jgi:hypothetical protein
MTKASGREWIGLALIALPCILSSMDLTVLNLAVPKLSAARSAYARAFAFTARIGAGISIIVAMLAVLLLRNVRSASLPAGSA